MVPPNDAVQLIYAVAKNPVMVGVDANTWPNPYGGGIFKNENCGLNLTHAVLIVGYSDLTIAEPYWIIKNSWGPTWGDDGYIKLLMTDGPGLCGVNMRPYYAVS